MLLENSLCLAPRYLVSYSKDKYSKSSSMYILNAHLLMFEVCFIPEKQIFLKKHGFCWIYIMHIVMYEVLNVSFTRDHWL